MPHTSHKKKKNTNNNTHKKRHVSVDEDGWTRVVTTTTSTGTRIPNIAQPRPTPSQQQLAFSWKFGDKHVAFDMSLPTAVAAPSDMTADKMDKRYRAVEARWLESESWAGLEDALRQTATRNPQDFHISKCILVGSGSCSTAPSGREEVTYYQVAAFKAAKDLIQQLQGTRPVVYAQEPLYNGLDAEYLETLGISVVDHPGGFEAVGDGDGAAGVFVFSPCAERYVELQIMHHRPSLWLHRPLADDRWPPLDVDGTTTPASPLASLDWMLHGRSTHGIADPLQGEQDRHGRDRDTWEPRLRAEYLINRALFEDSRRRYEALKLPSLPAHNYPFEGVALLRYDEACDDQ